MLLLPEQLVSTTCPDHNNKLLHLKEWSPKRGYLFPSNMQSGFDLDLDLELSFQADLNYANKQISYASIQL